MKRRNFFVTMLSFITLLPLYLNSRNLNPLEFTAANKRKRVDKRWMHMNKSFDYFDYDFIDDMGFGLLRVLDDFELDHLSGTPVHPHKDMEILTILLKGQIFHQDSLGNSGLLKAGDYQLMSAGKGLKHAETNPSQFEKAQGLQIWISSKNEQGTSYYQQRGGKSINLNNRFTIIASHTKNKGMYLEQEAQILRGQFDSNKSLNYKLKYPENGLYVFLIEGEITVLGKVLKNGDGLGISTKKEITLMTQKRSDILLIEVPKQGAF